MHKLGALSLRCELDNFYFISGIHPVVKNVSGLTYPVVLCISVTATVNKSWVSIRTVWSRNMGHFSTAWSNMDHVRTTWAYNMGHVITMNFFSLQHSFELVKLLNLVC